MARVLNIDIDDNKAIAYALTAIYGIGISTGKKIAEQAQVSPNKKVKDLTENELTTIRKFASQYKTEGEARREKALNIKRLIEIHSYRGQRHVRHLPVRGQTTKTNARTMKGPRKTVANKKKATSQK